MGETAISAPHVVLALVFFLFGCVVGSFLNVCIWRLPRGMSIHDPPRSICPNCKTSIRAEDNIPLLSYILLRGRCRCCGAAISLRYPIVEGTTGFLFAAIYILQGSAAGQGVGISIVMALTIALLVAASAIDMEFLIVPDEITVFGIMGGLLAGLLMPELHLGKGCQHTLLSFTGIRPLDGLFAASVGALSGGGIVLFFATLGSMVFRKEAMGFGDVKLMAMVGAFMGWKVAVLAFFFAPFFGLLYGVPLLLLKDKHVMPYCPFLSAAAVLMIVFRTSATCLLRPAEELVRFLLGR